MHHAGVGRRAIMLLAINLAIGCGGASSASGPSTSTGNPPPPANTVRVTNNAFTPGDLTVPAGTTVTWNWDSCSSDPYGTGQTCVSHSVVLDDGSVASATLSTGSFTHQFTTAGTYPYHCAIHGAAMSGRIIVQ